MLNKSAVIAALVVALTAPLAGAYSIVESESYQGKVEGIDVAARELTIELKSGGTVAVELGDNTQVITDNRRTTDLAAIQPGQFVKYKKEEMVPASETIKGEILSVDKQNYVARIRLNDGSKVVTVSFNKDVVVRNSKKEIRFSSLQRGYEVTIGYPAQRVSMN